MLTELTQLLYREASLLDAARYEDWLDLLAPDIVYRAPIRPEVDPAAEPVESALRLEYFTDDLAMLQVRVGKIRTGLLQTENPPSRTVRLISNVHVQAAPDSIDSAATPAEPHYFVASAFLLYRHRRQREVEILAGHRNDRWRQTPEGWRLAEREILFAANVLPTKSLSLFY